MRFAASQQPTLTPTHIGAISAFVAHDIAYASLSEAQKLDIYLPAREGPYPVIVYVHGGAFKFGDKKENEATKAFSFLLAAGYALVSINYRLSGEAKFPAQIEDVKAAVRWLRAHATDYHFDAQHFGAWGASAGGHLVALLGTSAGVAELEGAYLGNADQASNVQAVVDWYGPTDFLQMDAHVLQNAVCSAAYATHNNPDSPESELMGAPIQTIPEIVRTANPIAYVNQHNPPFLLQHGTADCIVPPLQSQLLYDALLPMLGTERAALVYLSGAKHADKVFPQEANMQLVVQFFDKHLR